MAITFDLASNAVVNDGQTASFEVSNIQGVQVTGCPIGKTFYDVGGGYDSWDLSPCQPFSGSIGCTVVGTSVQYALPNTSPTSYGLRWIPKLCGYSNTEFHSAIISITPQFSSYWGYYPLNVTLGDGRLVVTRAAGANISVLYVDVVIATVSVSSAAADVYISFTQEDLVVNNTTIDISSYDNSGSAVLKIDTGNYINTGLLINRVSLVASIGLPNNCTGEVQDATIEYYRNGVLDYTGNPWSFPADGSMDGDSIVARVSDGVDFAGSDPVTMSVLHYTNEPPSPQNLTEGDPFNATWDIAGVDPVGSVTDYTVNKNGVPVDSSSTTDTTISYLIPSVALIDAGDYDLTITNGGRDPFLSDPVVVNVGSGIYDPFNTITKGAKSVNTYTFYGCSTEIALGMDRNVDSRGFVQWLDNGKEYDNYYSEYSLDTENGKALEEILTDDTINVATISTPFVNGFYPFSPLFATNQDYSVYFSDGWKGLGDLDVNGLHRKYTLTIVPAVQDIYSSYTLNGVVSQGCIVDNWQINGVPFPFSEWSQDLNNLSRVVTLGGNASEIVDTKREYGDVVKLNLNCGEEQARQILYFITHVMRGTVQTATFPDVYNIFGRRYEGLTSCKVKLHSDILKVTHDNYHEVTIELELQMVGV